ncbi:MAG: sugar ABC transporter ATP-binding protein [Boseongicola sp. SB0676_bin_33]|uniref:Sugar ABC transporter ATP-binding protein n=1 Tax=Boseongicola sp. SB0664_bin_43 TaxID=2604844 RepID=A0A6B0Y3S3_9RHOB|nr:sugar ABC transporter ATP-binding protein [Boseongicola sp. SB0664_bin_43]MYF90328.1 sugar ABC transporter ATP-binding protein [Boseongicola sp. SB0676_bin_33]MYK33172.1 sugar ABC transporter ATP-binding protein [Boseongicola sp. SB0670_bin_30]
MSILELSGVEKSFGAVQVLHGVDLNVDAGEVLGLVGDNGAGKSTLMKSITGVYSTDKGNISFDGTDVTRLDPGERREMGIEMIYQDLALAAQQDVANNIFLGREPTKRMLGFIPSFVDKRRIDRQAQEMLDRLGVHVPSVHIPVGMLSGGQQQTIAIARALTFKPKLVIMDEPTAALAVREVESVLRLIEQMRAEGIATILISHRLNDVFEACGRIVVLRRGNVIADLRRDETDMAEVVSYIVGAHG